MLKNSIPNAQVRPLINKYLSEEKDSWSKRTVKNYTSELKLFTDWVANKDLNYDTAVAYRAFRLTQVSAPSSATSMQILKAFISWLHRTNKIELNFGSQVRRPKEKQSRENRKRRHLPTPDEVETVIELATKPGNWDHKIHQQVKNEGRRALRFIWRYPLRISEILSITGNDLNFDSDTPEFAVIRKNRDEWEWSPIPHDMVEELAPLQSRGKDKVFNVAEDRIRKYLHKGCKLAGIPYFTPHKFRHIAGTYMINNGATIPDVAEILGHTTQVMETIYKQMNPAHQALVIQKFSPAYNKDRPDMKRMNQIQADVKKIMEVFDIRRNMQRTNQLN